jgi:hypothetical protein
LCIRMGCTRASSLLRTGKRRNSLHFSLGISRNKTWCLPSIPYVGRPHLPKPSLIHSAREIKNSKKRKASQHLRSDQRREKETERRTRRSRNFKRRTPHTQGQAGRPHAGRFSAPPIRSLVIAHRPVPEPNCTLGNSTEKPLPLFYSSYSRIVP